MPVSTQAIKLKALSLIKSVLPKLLMGGSSYLW